jgi:S-adenosylmethionine decarboxylase
MNALGKHTLLEIYGCDATILADCAQVREIMLEAARCGHATIVNEIFHQFSPQGVSGVVVIAESHLAIHTWPEHGYAAVDLFTCSDTIDVEQIEHYLATAFGSQRLQKIALDRGLAQRAGTPSTGMDHIDGSTFFVADKWVSTDTP